MRKVERFLNFYNSQIYALRWWLLTVDVKTLLTNCMYVQLEHSSLLLLVNNWKKMITITSRFGYTPIEEPEIRDDSTQV